MKLFTLLVAWCILLVLSWPAALLLLVLAPLLWLLLLPVRLVTICVGAVFALLQSLLFLPARLSVVGRAPPNPEMEPTLLTICANSSPHKLLGPT